jgi:hypothetical protein
LQGQLGFAQNSHVTRLLGQSATLKTAAGPLSSCLGAAASTSAKKEAARKGRLQFGRWFVCLEEDHATDLEEVEIFKAGAEILAELLIGLSGSKDWRKEFEFALRVPQPCAVNPPTRHGALSVALMSSSRCCQRAKTCMAAESIA